MPQLQFVNVDFTYQSLSIPLIDDLSFVSPAGWTGIVGANGIGKTTILDLAAGRISPDSGTINRPETVEVCDQRTDDPPGSLSDLLSFPDADAGRLASLLGLGGDWPYRWKTLSHGERKRAQIACAVWKNPDLLIVDEPTNHLDTRARRQLAQALESYTGVGLIVSHDRALLDRLCMQCLFVDSNGAVMRPGGVDKGLVQFERERREQMRTYERRYHAHRRLETEARRRSEHASVQDKKRSKRGLRWKDSDAREKKDVAIVSGADGKAGRLYRQLDGRRQKSADELAATKRPVKERVGISVHGRRSRADAVIYREPGTVALPDGRSVKHPELVVRADDRIILQGENGAGKSTLVSRLTMGLHREHVWIPQEIDSGESWELIEQIRSLNSQERGRVISTVSRLGSEPERVLETGLPSPGETRKLMLALGLEREPELIIMDEPTNHLDIVSITCLESALSEFEGALLLVSHDQAFVQKLGRIFWTIAGGGVDVTRPG